MRLILIQCFVVAAILLTLPTAVSAAQAAVPVRSAWHVQAEVSPMPSADVTPDPGDDPTVDATGGIRIPLPLGLLLFAIILSAGLVVGKFQAARR